MSDSDAHPEDGNPHACSRETAQSGARQESVIYQDGRSVGEVFHAQIDVQAREIRFDEIIHSDNLLIPDDCEFRDYRILIQKISFASRQETGAAHKGRVLKGVVAEILGHRQQ